MIISDILMPVMGGFQFCRTLKKDPKIAQIPLIFYTTSYTEQKDRLFGFSLGADEYISKPIEPDDFIAAGSRMDSIRKSKKPYKTLQI